MSRVGGFERICSGVIMVCAVVVTWTYLRDARSSEAAHPDGGIARDAEFIEGWTEEVDHGTLLAGPADAKVTIMEFMDFQCPFCRRFVSTVDSLLGEFPDEVRVLVFHFPLTSHGQSSAAAVALECANHQGRFSQMFRWVFDAQPSLGAGDWSTYAQSAGVKDINAFADCLSEEWPAERVSHGRTLGERIGIPGTPAVLVNGWKLHAAPPLGELREMVEAILAEDQPLLAPDK